MNLIRYVGIDPGKKGAVAVLDSMGNPISIFDLHGDSPILFGKFSDIWNKSFVHEVGSSSWKAAIEDPATVPKESTASAKKLGISIGQCSMMMASLDIEQVFVAPQTWKRAVFFGTRFAKGPLDKKAARGLAEDILGGPPGDNTLLGKRSDEGRAEAFLIARWLWSIHATKPKR